VTERNPSGDGRDRDKTRAARQAYKQRLRDAGMCPGSARHPRPREGRVHCDLCIARSVRSSREWRNGLTGEAGDRRSHGKRTLHPGRASSRAVKQESGPLSAEMALRDQLRPRTRGECVDGPRPCIWVSCKHHLGVDVDPHSGALIINFGGVDPTELHTSCVLDVADARADGVTLDDVGALLNVTRERVRQIEARALIKIRRSKEGAAL
jgi:hypothetical protein